MEVIILGLPCSMQSTSNLDVLTEINQSPKDLDQIPFLRNDVSSGKKTYGILLVDVQLVVDPDAIISLILQRISRLDRAQQSNVRHQSTNGSSIIELQPTLEIHQSQDDFHSIVDKEHKIQASPQSFVNILLHYSQHLDVLGRSPSP